MNVFLSCSSIRKQKKSLSNP